MSSKNTVKRRRERHLVSDKDSSPSSRVEKVVKRNQNLLNRKRRPSDPVKTRDLESNGKRRGRGYPSKGELTGLRILRSMFM